MSVLAYADLGVLGFLAALLAFGVAIWLVVRGLWVAALCAAVIAVLIAVYLS